MGGLEFLGVIATFLIVVAWYVQNAEAKSDGGLGWLALVSEPVEAVTANRRSYSVKQRAARRGHENRDIDGVRGLSAASKPSYRVMDEESYRTTRKAYRYVDEARYTKSDAGSRYKERSGPTAKLAR